jgi:hypothetical protein
MGAAEIQDKELSDIGIKILGKSQSGSRKLKLSTDHLSQYINLVKTKLTNGFWNEVVGSDDIVFVFKFKDGKVRELTLKPSNEKVISELCSKFNGDPLDKTTNVYKYVSENDFYRDFMLEHYSNLINR